MWQLCPHGGWQVCVTHEVFIGGVGGNFYSRQDVPHGGVVTVNVKFEEACDSAWILSARVTFGFHGDCSGSCDGFFWVAVLSCAVEMPVWVVIAPVFSLFALSSSCSSRSSASKVFGMYFMSSVREAFNAAW
jgi:hypothetical protein